MNKQITIYELLGLIKDEPNYELYVKYINNMSNKEEIMWACEENIFDKLDNKIIFLNDKVEILKEDKPIIEKINIEQDSSKHFYIKNEYGTKCSLTKHSKMIADKLNEVISYINRKEDK